LKLGPIDCPETSVRKSTTRRVISQKSAVLTYLAAETCNRAFRTHHHWGLFSPKWASVTSSVRHLSLYVASVLQFLKPAFLLSLYTTPIHLTLCLLNLFYFFQVLVHNSSWHFPVILITCPPHLSLAIFIIIVISGSVLYRARHISPC